MKPTAQIDTAVITVKSGDGGPGSSSFRREKYVSRGGPDGGNGGNGGSVFIVGQSKIRSLSDFRKNTFFKAKNGNPGQPKKKFGSNGDNIHINVPIGTVIIEDNSVIADITKEGQIICILKGGKGGKGNVNFANAINKAPTYSQPGQKGMQKILKLELKLIAQVGIIGLPSAGKSTLLKTLTKSNVKIGNYPFTTLYPNLGTLQLENQELILSDIPGLISGSSKGLGLGNQFLRHIERTELLIHLVECNHPTFDIFESIQIIKSELLKSKFLTQNKPTIIVISKIDCIELNKLKEIKQTMLNLDIEPILISCHQNIGIQSLIHHIFYKYSQFKH